VRRHDLDWVSLVAGLVFTGLAGAYLLSALTTVSLNPRIVWPIVFVALGIGGLATAIRANNRAEQAFASVPTEATDQPTPLA
jgi:hypothetical protein